MSRGASCFGMLVACGLSLVGCATTTTRLESADNGTATYRIECIRLGDCWSEAHRACRGNYQTLERHDNMIPESELPGLNERTAGNDYNHRGYSAVIRRSTSPYGPDRESDEPMPLTGVVVACVAPR